MSCRKSGNSHWKMQSLSLFLWYSASCLLKLPRYRDSQRWPSPRTWNQGSLGLEGTQLEGQAIHSSAPELPDLTEPSPRFILKMLSNLVYILPKGFYLTK